MNTRITLHSIACGRANAARSQPAPPSRCHAMNPTTGSTRAKARLRIRHLVLAALALTAMVVAGPVFADDNTCSSNSKSGGTVTFTLPSEIVVPQGAASGTTLWTSSPVTPVNPPLFSSCGIDVPNGLENATSGGPSAGDNTLYPTNLTWLSFRILDSTGVALKSFPNQPFPSGSDTTTAANAEISQPFQLQLVITGPVPGGNQMLPTGQLVTWDFMLGGGKIFTVATFNLGGSVNIIRPCTIAVDPTTVTLPTVMASAFTGVGSTTGNTPFQIKLTNCPKVNQLSITLNTSNPYTTGGVNGVILNTATQPASGVGVQLLDANHNNNPVTFGTAIPEGSVSISGTAVNLPFVARYYQTGVPVTAGNVTAVATYTLNYQ